jgi:hypothetical protein
MSKTFIIILAAIAVIVLVVGVPNFIRARSTRAAYPCINNLRIIEAAKNQWMLDRGKTTNDVPTWNDIRPYFPSWLTLSNGMPVCPDGGTYTLWRVGERPTCSLGDKDPGHKLP